MRKPALGDEEIPRNVLNSITRGIIPTYLSGLSSMEIQPPTPNPHPLPPKFHDKDQPKSPQNNSSLDPKAPLRPHRIRPRNLEIANNKPARRSREINPRRYLSTSLRITIQVIRV